MEIAPGLLKLLGVQIDYDRVNLGGGISLDGYSFDEGKTWWLAYQNMVVLETDFMLGMHAHNSLSCAVLPVPAELS